VNPPPVALPAGKCGNCGQIGFLRQHTGFENKYYPHNYVLRLIEEVGVKERKLSGKAARLITLDEEFSLPHSAGETEPHVTYGLQAVIKHAGEVLDGGHYIAFTRSKDNNWWRCDGGDIRTSKLSDVLDINNEKDGQPYLLFYHKKQKK
jgi:hypothetical protein